MGTSKVSGKKPELSLMILGSSGAIQVHNTLFITAYGHSSTYKTTHHNLGIPTKKLGKVLPRIAYLITGSLTILASAAGSQAHNQDLLFHHNS